MLDAKTFLDQIQLPPTKLSIKQLREREEFWRAIWSWIDDEVKYFVLRVGQPIRVVRRDYKGTVGELGTVKFEKAEIEVKVYEKVYNYSDGKYHWEDKVVKIPSGAIQFLEFINSDEIVEEKAPEVAPLSEAAEDTAKTEPILSGVQ